MATHRDATRGTNGDALAVGVVGGVGGIAACGAKSALDRLG